MVRKEAVIDCWKSVRQQPAQAVEDFPAAELDFKATPDLMSFGELARHILDAGHALTGMLLDGVDNLATPQFREMIGKYKPHLPERLDPPTLPPELRKSTETRPAERVPKNSNFSSGSSPRSACHPFPRPSLLHPPNSISL